MANAESIESILVADCGTVITKLLLLERVEDSYRFVAQAETMTTINPPWNDVSIGVVQAIGEIEQITGRVFYSQGRLLTPRKGQLGVDAFVVILSAPEPLHVVIAGMVREMSLESARRAVAGANADIRAILSREGNPQSPMDTWAHAVRDLQPDVVLLVGGVDGGAKRPVMELARAIALGISAQPDRDRRPTVLYAGNAELRPGIVKSIARATRVEVVDNVHPSVETEHLGPTQSWLESHYITERLQKTPGVDILTEWSRLPLLPTAAAFARVVDFMWHREHDVASGVLGIDVGAANTTVAATFGGRPYVTVYGRGIAYGPLTWLNEHPIENLMRWIPDEIATEDLLNFLHNRELYPWTIPQDPKELWIEQAIAREMLRGALDVALPTWNIGEAMLRGAEMPHLNPILISGGGMVHVPRPGQTLLVVLDGLEPVGISSILLDINRAAPALGAVAGVKPLAAVAALGSGTLVSLGTVISPVGRARPGETILRMHIAYEDGGFLDVEAHYGEIEIWPLQLGQKATIDIKPVRRVDVGLGPGRGGTVQVEGGLVGLVVDARGRPLILPDNAEKRREILNRWIWDVGG